MVQNVLPPRHTILEWGICSPHSSLHIYIILCLVLSIVLGTNKTSLFIFCMVDKFIYWGFGFPCFSSSFLFCFILFFFALLCLSSYNMILSPNRAWSLFPLHTVFCFVFFLNMAPINQSNIPCINLHLFYWYKHLIIKLI